MVVRYQIEVLKDRVGDEELEISLAERRAEGGTPPAPSGSDTPPAAGSGAPAEPAGSVR